jgi:hypothetical protein
MSLIARPTLRPRILLVLSVEDLDLPFISPAETLRLVPRLVLLERVLVELWLSDSLRPRERETVWL